MPHPRELLGRSQPRRSGPDHGGGPAEPRRAW
jgi:hypothetical protein